MVVLGVGYATGAQELGLNRAVETLIGAAVGVLDNVVFPPEVGSRYARQAVQRLAEEIAALLDEAAEGLGGGPRRAADLVHRLRPPHLPGTARERPHGQVHRPGSRAGPADAPGTAPPPSAPEQRRHLPPDGPPRPMDPR